LIWFTTKVAIDTRFALVGDCALHPQWKWMRTTLQSGGNHMQTVTGDFK